MDIYKFRIFYYYRENIVVVQFFYQEMKEENVKQEPSYDFYKLVGKFYSVQSFCV